MSKEKVCVPEQLDGSVGTEAKKIDGLDSGLYVEFYIHNTHLSNVLYLSMYGQQHWKKIVANDSIRLRGTAKNPIKINAEDFYLKASAQGTTYECLLLRIV